MKVELLYFEGCPSHERFAPQLRELLAAAGVKAEIEERRVESAQAAISERFLGSPTVRLNGVDVDPSAAGRCDYGLKCRLYETPDGLQGTPPEQWVIEALSRAGGETDGEEHRAA
jgi:hypothetical protein